MTYVACCHSATYSFTSKPEKGGEVADEACCCQPLYKLKFNIFMYKGILKAYNTK